MTRILLAVVLITNCQVTGINNQSASASKSSPAGTSTGSGTDPAGLLPLPWIVEQNRHVVQLESVRIDDVFWLQYNSDAHRWELSTSSQTTDLGFLVMRGIVRSSISGDLTSGVGVRVGVLMQPPGFGPFTADDSSFEGAVYGLSQSSLPSYEGALTQRGVQTDDFWIANVTSVVRDRTAVDPISRFSELVERSQKVEWALQQLGSASNYMKECGLVTLAGLRLRSNETSTVEAVYQYLLELAEGDYLSRWLAEISIFEKMERSDRIDWLQKIADNVPMLSELAQDTLETIVEEERGQQ